MPDISKLSGVNWSSVSKLIDVSVSSIAKIAGQAVPSSFLLDEYTGSVAAYSVRRLNSSYTGACMRVREASGNTETDIGFDSNGYVDTAAIETHCGSADGFVTTLFDQSGNGRDATQSTSTLQPKICSSGSTLLVNGKAAILFNGDYLDVSAFSPNPNGKVNQAYVCQFDSITVRQCVAAHWGSSTATQNHVFQLNHTDQEVRSLWRYSAGTSAAVQNTGTATNTQYVASFETTATTFRGYFNGTLVNLTSGSIGSASSAPNNASSTLRLGALNTNGTQLFEGSLQECVMWSNTTSLNAQNISTDINSYYGAF